MAKQLNVNLAFTADTGKVKAELQDLQRQLDGLLKGGNKKMVLTDDILKAQSAAAGLKVALDSAINSDTGKLDLTKFSESLRQSKLSIKDLQNHLMQLGPEGQKAFMSLTQSILTAEVPIKRTSALLNEMWTTMKNTARWQLSSSALHGFMGTLQSAFGYAQDLDKSLNDIRIVTGASVDEMGKFAERANKAAKALSTTTTTYTDAALIFYQQGLSDQEVEKRTDVTIKMAHAAGEDATEVSSYMTAIWNNFDDGSKSLEYYGDVMQALGAKTAASSAEIADALEKFAAIGDTVGLSYEYATAAVATVVDKTRQSADTVGTAFKTIFARLQGLQLGETLEDGVDLNKYSAALEKVGVEVIDLNGELRSADDIVYDLGMTWDTLTQAQQTALAQTVAGTRQYTQLIALMENFDAFQSNVNTARGAEGTLDEAADTYAESWKAAQDRVRAAAEGLYDSLIDEEFFISLANGLEKIISAVESLVNSLGGMQGVLSAISVIALKVFDKQLTTSVNNFAFNVKSSLGMVKKDTDALRQQAYEGAMSMNYDLSSNESETEMESLRQQIALQKMLEERANLLTDADKARLQYMLDINKALGDQAIALAKVVDMNQQNLGEQNRDLRQEAKSNGVSSDTYYQGLDELQDFVKKGHQAQKAVQGFAKEIQVGTKYSKDFGKQAKSLSERLKKVGAKVAAKTIKDLTSQFKKGEISAEGYKKSLEHLVDTQEILDDSIFNGVNAMQDVIGIDAVAEKDLYKLANTYADLEQNIEDLDEAQKNQVKSTKDIGTDILNAEQQLGSFGSKVVLAGQGLAQLSMGINALTGIGDILNNEDLSTWEKFTQITGALTMGLPALISGITSLYQAKDLLSLSTIKSTVAAAAETVATKVNTAAKGQGTVAAIAHTAATLAETLAAWGLNAALAPLVAVVLLLVAAFAALALGAFAIVAIFNAIKNSTPEAKLKAAEEEAARLGEELNKATEASEALKESIESYDTAVDKIKTLQKGTEEYRQAVEEANAEARKLIDENSKELAGKYSFNAESGLIEFDEGVLDELQATADDRVKAVQAQKLMADNAVLGAQQNITNRDASKENNVMGDTASAIVASTGVVGMAVVAAQAINDSQQQEAMSKLQEAYYKNDGNFAEAMNSLDASTRYWIETMDYNSTQLEEMCVAARENTEAMLENNKQIIDTRLAENKDYKYADNKQFLNTIMADDLREKTDELYDKDFEDQLGGKTDAEIQKEYAKLMGWTHVKDESGNKGIYQNAEGEEVTVSDENARKYLAQEAALEQMNEEVEDYIEKVEILEEAEMKLANAYESGAIDYNQYTKELSAIGKQLGLNQKEMNEYISNYASDNMIRAGLENTLMESMKSSFNMDESQAKAFVQGLSKDLTNEEVQMAIDVAATAQSLDDFKRQFQHVMTDSLINSVNESQATTSNILKTAEENGEFTQADFTALENDKYFTEWLEKNQMEMSDIIYASYTEQYNMISQFYADVNALQRESLAQSKENYQEDLQEYQAILDYKKAQENNDKQGQAAIANAWGDKIDFEAYMDMDITELESKLDEARNQIEEITNKQYEISMSWDGIDQIEGGMDEVRDITKLVSKEAKKVGNAYQLTAEQSREWMEMYPELFDTAKVTTDGLIELSDQEYQDFKTKQEEKRQLNIKAQLKEAEDALKQLEEERDNAKIRLDIFTSMKNGEINLEKASAADLTAVRDSLTQFYIDSGFDEVNANKKALEDMGLSQEQYNKLIADSTEDNSQNITEGFKSGFSKVTEMLKTFAERLKNVFSNIGSAIKAIFTGDWDSIGTYFSNAWTSAKEAFVGVKNDYTAIRNNTYGNFQIDGQYTKYKTEAEYNEAQTKHMDEAVAAAQAELDRAEKQIANKKAQIVYLQALANQDIEDYGSTDPNDVDGSKNRVKEEDLIKLTERYHEITREIKQQETALDRLAKKKDRAFGSAVLGIIDDEIEALDILYQKQEELLKIQSLYLASDKDNVTDMFANAQFDDYGNISNYTELLTQATNTVNAARLKLGGSENESDKQALEDAEALYERQVEILEQYEETLDAWNEQVDILKDVKNQIQDANFEKITYKVELNVEVNERELAEIDYYLNKISEDFYMMEEAATLLKGKMGNFNSELEATEIQYHELEEAYKKNEISQGQYIEGLKNSYDGIMNNLSALNDLDKEMLHYYEDTLSAASEETDYYISQMEHLTGVLDHYRNIVELVNGEYDYEAIGTILEGQAKTRENEMAVATAEYEMLLSEKEAIEKQMASVEVGSAAWDLYNEELQAITQATMEAEEEMLSKTEAWAESMKAIMENTFATAAYEMEMMMTQGLGFDALSNSLDKLSTFQEEYLTNTNEIFELEKMMRTAQQAADKTNNEAAKIKLKNYQNEIETLKNDGLPLSQLELNIQKAKYDLLLAEIALEEAQNAKSTVRLQRDSEGNFGYVYTADTEAISSAEQDLADAQNNLYNIGLEGTNDYGQKLLELQNQLSDDLIALEEERAAGRFKTDEEYYTAKNDLITYYNNLFTAYSNQYTTALGVDNRIQEDAWINAYQNMIVKTENWKDYTKEYTQECEDAYDEWRENAVDNNELIQDVLDDTEDEVKEVTKASDNLKKKVVNEVIPAVESELIAVRNITSAYAKQRAEIKRTVSQYEKLITTIREAIAAQAALAGESSIGYNEKGQVTDYSWAMADYLANKGGAYGDAHWERLVSERNKKLETDEYSKYADGADDFEEMMEKYYKYKTQGVDNELTKYVEDVIANKQYWDQNKVENLIDEFATGGYTGAWGPEGRLAVVHEKELMLNQEDTVNFLQGIGLLREIAQMIDLEAMRNQLGALPYLPIANMQGAGGLLEQSVHIEANFPGVSDRYEIEEAFNNILNTATQYANRKI